VFVLLHVDSICLEANAFELQTCLLFTCGFAGQLDLASSAEDAVPWQAVGWIGAQQASDGAVMLRISSGGSDLSIGAHTARGDGEDHAPKGVIALLFRPSGVTQKASLGALHP
jgi:hypothetical protein